MIIRSTKDESQKWANRRGVLLLMGLVLCLAVLLMAGSLSFKSKAESKDEVIIVYCDAETTDSSLFIADRYALRGGDTQSPEASRSGGYSSRQGNGIEFGMTFTLDNPTPGAQYRASVWMLRSGSERGAIVASADKPDLLYTQVSKADSISNGWELLNLRFSVPSQPVKFIKVYTYVPASVAEQIYFDDLTIVRLVGVDQAEEVLPGTLKLDMPQASFDKLMAKAEQARRRGVLITEEDDWVTASLSDSATSDLPINVRLKGDYLDHIEGLKWSLRIKGKGEGTWSRMRTFSMQSPHTRSFLEEYVFHKMLDETDVLNPRYMFADVEIDFLKDGVYAIEEHFEKYLVEYKRRREGPILKMSEDGLWLGYKRELDNMPGKTLFERLDNAFWKSDIRAFKENRMIGDTAKMKQFEAAQNMLYAYKYGYRTTSQTFDIERLAALYAIMDVNVAYHGKAWHNQRFYYNPVTSLLEPVGFDGFTEYKPVADKPFMGYYFDEAKGHIPFDEVPFTDTAFFREYCSALSELTEPEFILDFFDKYGRGIEAYEALIKTEYADYVYDRQRLAENAGKIQLLATPYDDVSLLARTMGTEGLTRRAAVYNMHCLPLDIVGYGYDREAPSTYFDRPSYIAQQKKQAVPEPVEITVPRSARFLFFSLAGTKELFVTEISDLPPFNTELPRDFLVEQPPAGTDILREMPDGTKVISAGPHVLEQPLIIEKGSQLVIEAGATLDLKNGAFVMSYGTVTAIGNSGNPITLQSSDRSGQGLIIMNAPGKSVFEYVELNNMDALNFQGWTLTGAFTVHESQLALSNCTINGNTCEDALNIIRSDFRIEGLTISNTLSDGFDADFCTGTISNSLFAHTGNDGMDFSGSRIRVVNVTVESAGDKGISAGEESTILVESATIHDSNIGVAAKDLSELRIKRIRISNCNTGYAAYQKKPEFGPASIIVDEDDHEGSKYPMMIQRGSFIIINGKRTDGSEGFEI